MSMLFVGLINDDHHPACNNLDAGIPDGTELILSGNLNGEKNFVFRREGSWVVRNDTNVTLHLLPPNYSSEPTSLPAGEERLATVSKNLVLLADAPPKPETQQLAPEETAVVNRD